MNDAWIALDANAPRLLLDYRSRHHSDRGVNDLDDHLAHHRIQLAVFDLERFSPNPLFEYLKRAPTKTCVVILPRRP